MREVGVFLCLILLLLLAAFGVLGEVMLAATMFPLFLATVVAIGLGVAELGRRWLHSRGLMVAGLVFALGFLVLRFIELNPAKPFRAFHRDLETGMSERSVLDLLDRHFPVDGAFSRPKVTHMPGGYLAITLDPNSSNWNSEIIDVAFEDGRLVGSEYLPD